jgi:hypothetical protein
VAANEKWPLAISCPGIAGGHFCLLLSARQLTPRLSEAQENHIDARRETSPEYLPAGANRKISIYRPQVAVCDGGHAATVTART